MLGKARPRIPTLQLIKRLRLMADTGGMLTRDRIEAVRQASDRLEELDERVAIMTENRNVNTGKILFDAMNDNNMYGGDGG